MKEFMRGVEQSDATNGASYMQVHYKADPTKDDAWVEAERPKRPVREWQREMEMDETIHDGEPVYADYRDPWHCPARNIPLSGIPVTKGGRWIGGWDCGQTLTPAFVLLQVTPEPWQVQAILEVISPGAESMETFAPRVLLALQRRLPRNWDEIDHWGDTTVMNRSGSNGETAQIVASRHGVRIRPSSNEWAGRHGAVTWLLVDSIEEKIPRFLVDPIYCPILREGFQGGYKLDLAPAGEAVGPGRVLNEMPLKNSYSHVHDALQYAASRVKRMFRFGRFDRTA